MPHSFTVKNRRTIRKAMRGNSGMTLVEIAVASALMVLVLAGLLATLVMARSQAKTAENRIGALNIARAKMEELVGMSYGNYALVNGTRSLPSVTNGNCVYRASYTVYATSVPNIKGLHVSVRWLDPGRKKERNIVMYTSMSKGLHP